MKKIYTTYEYKVYNKRKAIKQHNRTREVKEMIRNKRRIECDRNRASNLVFNNTRKRSDGSYILPAPPIFSVIDNAKEMVHFYRKIHVISEKKRVPLFFDMSQMIDLSEEALVYIIATLDWMKKKNVSYNISGNLPKNKRCSGLLQDSGFLDYFHTRIPHSNNRDYVVRLERGKDADPKFAKKIREFTSEHIDVPNKTLSDLYEIIVECMNNTAEHAFDEGAINPMWYLMAVFNKEKDEIKYTFLDAGAGIPATVRAKNIIERVFQKAKISDSDLVESALEGEFRSRTGSDNRGNGLPEIKKAWKEKKISDLIVISRNAFVFAGRKSSNLERSFIGTTLIWKIKGNKNE